MRVTFPSPVPLDSGCLIDIIFPSDLPITQTDLTNIRGVGLFGTSKTMTTVITTSTRTVTLSNGCDTYISPEFDAIVDFTQISNPLSTKPTDSLIVRIKDANGFAIAERTTGIQYVATFGEMSSGTMSATPTVIGSTSVSTISMFPNHKVTTAGAIKITFPSQITFSGTSCTLAGHVVISTSATCSISGQIVRITNPFTADYIPSASSTSTIQFTISSIVMPGTTAPTGTFTYETVLVSSSIDYVIDKSTYTNMITGTAGAITTASATPSSFVANALTTYTFSFQAEHEIVKDAKIIIVFPAAIILPTPATSANSCTAISGISRTLICTATSSTLTIISGYASTSQPAGSTVSFSITQVRNPVSMEPTSSFTISILTGDDYDIDKTSSGVTVTMTSVNEISSVAISPNSLVNAATTNLEISITASSTLKNGDLLRVTFPTQIMAPSGTITWVGVTALTSLLSCSKISTSPEIIQVTMSFSGTTSVSANELLKFTINGITNPTTTEPSDSFGFHFTNSNRFDINTYSGTTRVTTTEAAQLASASISGNSAVALENVLVDFTFTLSHDLPSAGVIYIYYPTAVTYDASNLSCQWFDTANLGTLSTCTCQQQTVGSENRIILRNAFPSGLSAPSSIKITLGGFINPRTATASSSFKIFTYTSETNGYEIDKMENGLTLTVTCDYPCLTCGSTTSTCTSCITTIDALILQDSTCVLNCDGDKFHNTTTNTCEDWADQWAECSDSDKDVCTSCGLTGYEFLLNSSWLGTWPDTYFGNIENNKCEACNTASAHCLNCSNRATFWTSWDTSSSFAYLQNNLWVSSCTADSYIQDSTAFTCTECDSNCLTCSGTTSTCKSWTSNMRLDERTETCVSTWEVGKTILNGNNWEACDPNWFTWAGTTETCTSCINSLVLTTSFTCSASCLNSNEITINNECVSCNPTCSQCTGTVNNCTACNEDYSLFENECISDCPLKYQDINRECIFVGLICPENYESNGVGEACIPTIKTCESGKELNSDKTKCIPPTGYVVPFPLLFIAVWFLIVAFSGKIKDNTRSRLIGNLIPLLGLLESPMILLLAITAAIVEAWIVFSIALVAFLISILINVVMYKLFKKHTVPDEDFQFFAKRYPKTSDALPLLCWIWSFRVLKFFYSGFFGHDTWMLVLSKSEQVFMKYFRRVIIAQFIFVHIPAYVASFIGITTLIWGYQALVESIEVPIILFAILILTLIEKRCEKPRLDQDPFLPLSGKNKYADDISVMSAVPFHRSMTKDKFNDEESKTENYSISAEADKYHKGDMEYDVELRKKALMSIVDHIKNPERRNSLFESDRSIGDCTFFEEEKYQSSQRRTRNKPMRRAFSFGGLNPIDEEEEFLLSDEESMDSDYRDKRFDKSPPKIQRRMSFPMRVDELESVENPVFSEAIDEYRNTLRVQLDDNCYADSRPPKPVKISKPPMVTEMGTQTMLREMLFDEDSENDFAGPEYEEAEIESDFAGNLIFDVIDNLSESSVFKEKKKLDAERLKEIPEFELEDILGQFDVDENGNFIIKTVNGQLVDNNNKRVNQKGYLIDVNKNIINKKGEIIFYAEEIDDEGEIPAPFVYEKHKNDFLSKALKRKEGITIDPNYMVDDDEDLVEAELNKLRPVSRESSIESLVAENPGIYVDESLSRVQNSQYQSPENRINSSQANRPTKKGNPHRNKVSDHDKELARSYGGKARGSIMTNYNGQPKRIKREGTKEMFPSLAVEDQAKQKLSKIVDGLSIKEKDSDKTTSMKNIELRNQLEKLKKEHFKDMDSDNLGDLNMDLIEQEIDEFDFNRQKQYEERMRRHIESSMYGQDRPPMYTNQNFYQNSLPFQNSDLLPGASRVSTAKALYNSQLESRSKIKPVSGLKRIYGNLGELVVPAEDGEILGRLHSPGSSVTLRSGFSRQQTRSNLHSNGRIRNLESIYLQKLEKRNKQPKGSGPVGKKRAKFRTLHNKFIDDPSILMHDDLSENQDDRVSKFEDKMDPRVARFSASKMDSNF